MCVSYPVAVRLNMVSYFHVHTTPYQSWRTFIYIIICTINIRAVFAFIFSPCRDSIKLSIHCRISFAYSTWQQKNITFSRRIDHGCKCRFYLIFLRFYSHCSLCSSSKSTQINWNMNLAQLTALIAKLSDLHFSPVREFGLGITLYAAGLACRWELLPRPSLTRFNSIVYKLIKVIALLNWWQKQLND